MAAAGHRLLDLVLLWEDLPEFPKDWNTGVVAGEEGSTDGYKNLVEGHGQSS